MTAGPQGLAADLEWMARRAAELFPAARRLTARELRELGEQAADAAGSMLPEDRARMSKFYLGRLFQSLALRAEPWKRAVAEASLPAAMVRADGGMALVRGRSTDGRWQLEAREGWADENGNLPDDADYAFLLPPVAGEGRAARVTELFRTALAGRWRKTIVMMGIGGLFANLLAVGTSLYSMQIYDRVVPTQGVATLIVLSIGTGIAILLEFLLKLARSGLLKLLVRDVDGPVAFGIFKQLMHVRLDQFPPSVGSLASQVRGYETIRRFVFALILYAIDLPFALIFLLLIMLIGSPLLGLVVLAFMACAILVGFLFNRSIADLSRARVAGANERLGLLVETAEGAETLKAAGAAWAVQLKWAKFSREAIDTDLKIQGRSESANYVTALLQQLSYASIVGIGAYLASTGGSLTVGAIIATSILSGRVLAPVAALPGLVMQYGEARFALADLDRLFALRGDNDACDTPLAPERIAGSFVLDHVRFVYPGQVHGLSIERFAIKAGEKVGLLGTVGTGKSTLLKLLAGVYAPNEGHVLIDDLDSQHISRQHLSEQVGYLPQDVRLFSGTMRDNLLLGLSKRDEEEIIAAAHATGLAAHISSHPKGFDLPITEGGAGLSRGQKQLVALTRLILARPGVWLLDEPTASMDMTTERACLKALGDAIAPEHTLVLIAHRAELFNLVDRLVVVGPQGILLDGPRDAVIARLQAQAQAAGPAASIRPVVVREAVQ